MPGDPRIAILGPLEVRAGPGLPVEVAGARLRRLLLRLALDPGRVVTIGAAGRRGLGRPPAGGGGQRPADARLRLRRLLPEALESSPSGYRLAVDAEAVDAVRFEALALAGRRQLGGDPDRARDLLGEALACGGAPPRGPPPAGGGGGPRGGPAGGRGGGGGGAGGGGDSGGGGGRGGGGAPPRGGAAGGRGGGPRPGGPPGAGAATAARAGPAGPRPAGPPPPARAAGAGGARPPGPPPRRGAARGGRVAGHPLSERLGGQLVRALALRGAQADALGA